MTHRSVPPLLYAQRAPVRWLRAVLSAVDDAAESLRRNPWQHTPVPIPVTVKARPTRRSN